ncbi:hypothetical protein H3N56_12455 [Cetobacterium sp. 2A]|uniref:hypothetical protein n=1 Tax=Cetobacterium sp. 2A TaxID=2754723 RepID=UPI00163BD5C9|nr:hypothetical protein [Cetobacterium sp. 2A]MBC2857244.1 hypothetical protein [Cetobacterium sp. 2A]
MGSNTNKTFEVYNYEDASAKTEINFNDEIILNQVDIEDIRFLYKHGIILIDGYIRHDDSVNRDNILKLNTWSREKGDGKNWLKKTNIKIARNGHVIRHLVFNSFIVDYLEYFNKGKHRFSLILRQYKLVPLEGTGETGATRTDSYIKHLKLKGVNNTVIMTPIENNINYSKLGMDSFFSALNVTTAIGMGAMLTMTTPIAVKFFIIAHGTGFITEFVADVYFVSTGRPEIMGSVNLTRDHFYKPLGSIVKNALDDTDSKVKLSDSFGEDIYNMGNLAFSLAELGKKGVKYAADFVDSKGIGYIYKLKVKTTTLVTSRFGRQLHVEEYRKLTPLLATKYFVKEFGLDTFSTGTSIKNEIDKKFKKVEGDKNE